MPGPFLLLAIEAQVRSILLILAAAPARFIPLLLVFLFKAQVIPEAISGSRDKPAQALLTS